MQILTRQEAKARYMRQYESGVPCKHGHPGRRYTASGACVVCNNEAQKVRGMEGRRRPVREGMREVTFRAEVLDHITEADILALHVYLKSAAIAWQFDRDAEILARRRRVLWKMVAAGPWHKLWEYYESLKPDLMSWWPGITSAAIDASAQEELKRLMQRENRADLDAFRELWPACAEEVSAFYTAIGKPLEKEDE